MTSNFTKKDTIVEVAGGKTILSTGFGDVDLKLDEENGGSEITLKSVLYFPELKENLLAAEKELKIIFEGNCSKLIAPNGKLVAKSIKYKRYYIKEKTMKNGAKMTYLVIQWPIKLFPNKINYGIDVSLI
ncbi:hypothetical protein JTB14_028495 [Gonioctena quinquepunctata]|nr:hypothetical protein JTB14_028495 [Gonioctena quinquepunctata]